MVNDYACACILLAAGASKRLGQPKQLLRMQGETLIHRAARLALEAGFSPVFVVIGYQAESMRRELTGLPVQFVENQDWPTGMSSSLRAGLDRVIRENTGHLLVLVCDQLAVSGGILARLHAVSLTQRTKIVASVYRGVLGVPAIFPQVFFEDLLGIEGDRGARSLLEAKRDQVVQIDFADGAIDIDTPADAGQAGLL